MFRVCIQNVLFLAAIALCVAAAPQKQYEIKLQRPAKVGDRCRMEKMGTLSSEVTATTAGRRAAPERHYSGVEIKAIAEVLEVDDRGSTTKMSFTVDKCIELKADHTERQLLPKGATFTAEFAAHKPLFKLTGGTLTDAQQQALTIIINPPPRNIPTSDDVYGTDQPQKIGASWPINAEALLQRTKPYGMTAKPEAVSGTVTLKRMQQQDGRDCLCLESQHKVADFSAAADADWEKTTQGLHVAHNTWESASTVYVPLSSTDAYYRASSTDTYVMIAEGQHSGRKVSVEFKRTCVVHTRSEPLNR